MVRLRSEIVRERVDGAVIATVAFDGDLDLPSVEAFRTAVSPRALGDANGVILDLAGLRFIDSSGIHALLKAWRELGASDRRSKLVVESGSNAERVLSMTGLLDRFEPAPDHAAAVDAIAGKV
jgi:anti-anti-sigma factor